MRNSMRSTGSFTPVKNNAVAVASGGDRYLIAAAALLVALGLVLVYSSSAVYADHLHHNAEYFLWRQLAFCAAGIVAAVALANISSSFWRQRASWLVLGALLTCLLVLVPAIGHQAGGQRRWLNLGFFSLQPSELAKIAVVVAVSALLAKREERDTDRRPSLLGPILLAQVFVGLILVESDLGTGLVIELMLAGMLFAAGLRPGALLIAGLAALPVFYHLVVGTPFRLQRLLGYIDPWAYRSSIGYQVTEALISIGSGGIAGVGLGEGKHKLFFLPEAHTDFIFAILGEELGYLGVLLVLVLFGLLVWRAMLAAVRAQDTFDSYLAVGLGLLIGVPAAFNMCVATGLLPTKGLPLPFLSYGGSDLVVNLAAVGILWRIGCGERRARSAS